MPLKRSLKTEIDSSDLYSESLWNECKGLNEPANSVNLNEDRGLEGEVEELDEGIVEHIGENIGEDIDNVR